MAAGGEPLLIVDDDPLIVDLLCDALAGEFDAVGAASRSEVPAALSQLGSEPRYALVDLGLPPHADGPQEGLALVRELVARAPKCAIVVVSGQDELVHGKVARTLGAIDFVAKPCDPQRIREALHAARRALDASAADGPLQGASPAIARVRAQIRQFAPAPYPVLIEGESGTGKELAAREVHRLSERAGPLVALNCSAIPAALFEAALFGAKRGSYTGSAADTRGFFEEADGGTLLLDEVGEMPGELQPKLLRTLESGEYYRVGEAKLRSADVRIVAATNRPLAAAAAAGGFRDDLLYRLGVLALQMPPLRAMGEDRMLLLDKFAAAAAAHSGAEQFALEPKAHELWMGYSFPGNVRELRNIVARLQVLHPGAAIAAAELAEQLLDDGAAAGSDADAAARAAARLTADSAPLEQLLDADARAYATAALEACESESAAAKRLGISVARLRKLAAS